MNFKYAAILILALLLTGCSSSPPGGKLMDFENESQLDHLFWRCRHTYEITSEKAPQGEGWLKAVIPPGRYPGLRIERLPKNWSGYQGLAFWAYAPGKAGEKLHLRIDDQDTLPAYNQRYNRIFTLEQEPKQFCAPLNREAIVNWGDIKLLMFFLYEQKTKTVLYLDDIHLVKSCDDFKSQQTTYLTTQPPRLRR